MLQTMYRYGNQLRGMPKQGCAISWSAAMGMDKPGGSVAVAVKNLPNSYRDLTKLNGILPVINKYTTAKKYTQKHFRGGNFVLILTERLLYIIL